MDTNQSTYHSVGPLSGLRGSEPLWLWLLINFSLSRDLYGEGKWKLFSSDFGLVVAPSMGATVPVNWGVGSGRAGRPNNPEVQRSLRPPVLCPHWGSVWVREITLTGLPHRAVSVWNPNISRSYGQWHVKIQKAGNHEPGTLAVSLLVLW